jgi:hypothetical protein
LEDYVRFGVSYVWVVDPATRCAHRWTKSGMDAVTELRTEKPETVVPVSELFD